MTKKEMETDRDRIRTQMKERRAALSRREWKEKSRQLLEQYAKFPFYQNADVLLAYCSVRGEPDLSDLFHRCFRDRKPVAVPRVLTSSTKGAAMEFVFLQPESRQKENRFHIPEPEVGEIFLPEKWKGKRIEMILPGLCFDRYGGRLGYGGGYYDRYLEHIYSEIHKTALAFEFQVVEMLPHQKQDILYDVLVTEQGAREAIVSEI